MSRSQLEGQRIFVAESAQDFVDNLSRGNATPTSAPGALLHARFEKNPSAEWPASQSMDVNCTSQANELCAVVLTEPPRPKIFLAESAQDLADHLARGNSTPAAAPGALPHARAGKNPGTKMLRVGDFSN